jgi:hypothetical protein
MRRGLAAIAALVAACGGGQGADPGSAENTGGRGSTGAASADAGAPNDPLARPIDAPLVLRFAYSLSEELACSESFESDGWSARYELIVEPSGAATLGVSADRSHASGPSAARFRVDMEEQTTREQSGSDRSWRGTAEWRDPARFAIALVPEKAACKTLVRERGWYQTECAPSAPIAITCSRGTVRARPAPGAAPAVAAADPGVQVEVWECAPPFGLPTAADLDVPLPAALPLAPPPGLELEYWRHGIGNFDEPELRVLPPDAGDVAAPE